MKRVLITDHNPKLNQFFMRALSEEFQVGALSKDINVFKDPKHYQAEIILITVIKEDVSCYQLFEAIKGCSDMSNIPIVFLSEDTDMEQEERALTLGAEDFIIFPISAKLLSKRISNCLELMKLRRERPYVERYQDAISTSFAELVECRDVTTGGHLKNTTTYFEILLKEACENGIFEDSMPQEDIRDLLRSAALHDIGKLGITDDILHKESSLNYSEFEFMKTHTTIGKQAFEKIIKETGGTKWLYLAKDMAYCHHERWDGTGYPNGLKGEEIPLYARMLTLADVYDALTSIRTYKEAYPHEKAIRIILEGRGSYFDPALVDIFVNANLKFKEQLLKNKEELS